MPTSSETAGRTATRLVDPLSVCVEAIQCPLWRATKGEDMVQSAENINLRVITNQDVSATLLREEDSQNVGAVRVTEQWMAANSGKTEKSTLSEILGLMMAQSNETLISVQRPYTALLGALLRMKRWSIPGGNEPRDRKTSGDFSILGCPIV